MARTLDQVVQDISGNFVLQIARLTVTNEEQAETIAKLEAELTALKAGQKNG